MSSFEQAARARKVSLLLDLVPTASRRVENACYATELASWTQERRDRFAAAAGATSPSDTTWAMLCAAVLGRKTGEDLLAEEAAGVGP
jgi:hypothetical protein